jgi:acetyl-CoA carboxylase biotin carboxylase subunit
VKVLIANRGEIAVRVIRACREMGFGSVAVYSDADRDAMHVRLADEAHHIGESPASLSYLRADTLIDVAQGSGATLVHPGYGFLAENEDFAQACQDAGLVFVGPSAQAISLMGGKTSARDVARSVGVPLVPGTDEPFDDRATDDVISRAAERIGYPLLVKAVAGGGGKGMRSVSRPEDLSAAIRVARSEAASAFGDSAVFLERRIQSPRHVEIQLLGDNYGTVVPFVERECSIQRRHQKLVEESPSTRLDPAKRREMAEAARRIASAAGYSNAGTIEFLLDTDGSFYFLEMNTRLQVEHPVTEAVTGVDLVHWQLKIALGERLTIPPERALTPRGHAIECRIIAEDPDRGFMPAPGLVSAVRAPSGPGVRDDRGVEEGFEIPLFYDSLVAKLIVWADTREDAVRRLARALGEYRVAGVTTTLPFFRWLVQQPFFLDADFDTTSLDRILGERTAPFVVPDARDERDAVVAAAVARWLSAENAAPVQDKKGSAWRRASRVEGLR